MKYKVVTVGGTFAYLHKGHKKILRKAFKISEKVAVGVTRQKLSLRGKFLGGQANYSFVMRQKEVERFLKDEGYWKRGRIREIRDMFGPLRKETEIEAMVVTRETRGNAERINKWRREHNLNELDIVEVGMVLAEDGKPISSTRIRNGEINREGIVYRKHKLWGGLPRESVKRDLIREELRKPLGELCGSSSEIFNLATYLTCPIITIGDVSTKRFIEAGVSLDIAVFDLKVRRKNVFKNPKDLGIGDEYKIIKFKNPAGMVSEEVYRWFSQLTTHVRGGLRNSMRCEGDKLGGRISQKSTHVRGFLRNRSLSKTALSTEELELCTMPMPSSEFSESSLECSERRRVALWIDGEEDLIALPAILFAPFGAIVVYGQPPVLKSKVQSQTKSKLRDREGKEAGQGLVIVEVTEEKKSYVLNILQQFEV